MTTDGVMRSSGSSTTGARSGSVRMEGSESAGFAASASVGGETRRDAAGAVAVLRTATSSSVLRRPVVTTGAGVALAGAGGFTGAAGA
ncbi:hypothetical protein D7V97_43160, partial [Corallococcus sp. CA053C]